MIVFVLGSGFFYSLIPMEVVAAAFTTFVVFMPLLAVARDCIPGHHHGSIPHFRQLVVQEVLAHLVAFPGLLKLSPPSRQAAAE